MSKLTFDKAFDRLIGHEGEFTNDPKDRGNWTTGVIGRGQLKGTKFGISAMTYPHLDIINLYGTNIFSGKGVCRHIGSMLTDILRESDIESYNYSNLCSVPLLYGLIQKYYRDVYNYQGKLDYVLNRFLVRFLKVNYIYAPHLISYASYDGKNYFGDTFFKSL